MQRIVEKGVKNWRGTDLRVAGPVKLINNGKNLPDPANEAGLGRDFYYKK